MRDLSGHGAVVLGAPLYTFRPHGDARSFLSRYGKALRECPFAVFGGKKSRIAADIRKRERLPEAENAAGAWYPSYVVHARAARVLAEAKEIGGY